MPVTTELQDYLHHHIPLSRAIGISVTRADEGGVTLEAPLEPNVNHRSTVFGGSAVSTAILACWSLVWVRLQSTDPGGRIVIHRSEMDYVRPLTGTFTASALPPSDVLWDRFLEVLQRRGKSRIHLDALVRNADGTEAGRFHGSYVVFGPPQG